MLETEFEDDMLRRIIDASIIYMCACPAQVAREIVDMRHFTLISKSVLITVRSMLKCMSLLLRQ